MRKFHVKFIILLLFMLTSPSQTSGAVLTVSVEVNNEYVGESFDGTVPVSTIFDCSTALVNGEVVVASEKRLTMATHGDEVSVTSDGKNVNRESLAVNKTVGGGNISAVVEARSVDVN